MNATASNVYAKWSLYLLDAINKYLFLQDLNLLEKYIFKVFFKGPLWKVLSAKV